MKQHFSKWLVGLVLLVGVPIASNAGMFPPQLSADMTMFQKHKAFDEGKLYVGKNIGRMDWLNKLKQTQIFRTNSEKIEAWVHQGNIIMEMNVQYNAIIHQLPPGWKEECMGEETVEGHPCQKCRISGPFMGQKISTTVWKAKDLKMVIKSMDDEGNGTVIKNIALGPQSETLFQAPAGYQRMTLPENLGDIFKGRSK